MGMERPKKRSNVLRILDIAGLVLVVVAAVLGVLGYFWLLPVPAMSARDFKYPILRLSFEARHLSHLAMLMWIYGARLIGLRAVVSVPLWIWKRRSWRDIIKVLALIVATFVCFYVMGYFLFRATQNS